MCSEILLLVAVSGDIPINTDISMVNLHKSINIYYEVGIAHNGGKWLIELSAAVNRIINYVLYNGQVFWSIKYKATRYITILYIIYIYRYWI